MLHEQCLYSDDGQLVLYPKETYRNILDLGTRTGIWTIAFADNYPGRLSPKLRVPAVGF